MNLLIWGVLVGQEDCGGRCELRILLDACARPVQLGEEHHGQ